MPAMSNHMKWVRTLACAECRKPGPSEAHHPTYGRGMGQKADDNVCFPLCLKCHSDFHSAKGTFQNLNKEQRRAWQEAMVFKYSRLHAAEDAF